MSNIKASLMNCYNFIVFILPIVAILGIPIVYVSLMTYINSENTIELGKGKDLKDWNMCVTVNTHKSIRP